MFTDAGIRTRGGAGAEFGEASVVARNIGKMLSSRVVEDCGGIRGKRAARKTLRQQESVRQQKKECSGAKKIVPARTSE